MREIERGGHGQDTHPFLFPLHSPSIPLSPTSTFRTPASDTYTYSLHPEPPENNHRYTTIYMRKLIMAAIALATSLTMTSAPKIKIQNIEPQNWYTGMRDATLQILLTGPGLRDADVTTSYPSHDRTSPERRRAYNPQPWERPQQPERQAPQSVKS